jgi:hypothetical protein
MRRDDDTIRDFATQFVPNGIFGSDSHIRDNEFHKHACDCAENHRQLCLSCVTGCHGVQRGLDGQRRLGDRLRHSVQIFMVFSLRGCLRGEGAYMPVIELGPFDPVLQPQKANISQGVP